MITERINQALYKHETDGNRPAKCLYLGRQEANELRSQARHWPTVGIEEVIKRDEYRGCRIYTVDEESYLAVGR